jgi:hypothetical protein
MGGQWLIMGCNMDGWMDGYKYCLFGVLGNSLSKTL